MNALQRRICETIRAEGPMRLDRYWNLALFDPEDGYYCRREPFGRTGDFTTAPEISQMFGELLGAWAAAAWTALGRPSPFVFAEIGPGRGTLMADMLRTIRRVAPDFLRQARVRLVEVSDRLAAGQLARLEPFDLPLQRVRRLEELDRLPLILLGNELLDAVAIRQFVFDGTGWRERCVAASEAGKLSFVLCPRDSLPFDPQALPPASAGAVLEVSPEREAFAAGLGARIVRHGGAALMIDYGHAVRGYGDTLQAVHAHAFADPLDRPGECDISSHVDFGRLGQVIAATGAAVAPMTPQGALLLRLGLRERAAALAARAGEAERAAVEAALRRLAGTGPKEMGGLFKVLGLASQPLALPPFGGD